MDRILKQTKALADGNRLRIIAVLLRYPELCVCQFTELLGLSTATVSRHISVIQNAGLVKPRKDSRWVYYRLADNFPEKLRHWLEEELMDTEEIKKDMAKVEFILSMKVEELCRKK